MVGGRSKHTLVCRLALEAAGYCGEAGPVEESYVESPATDRTFEMDGNISFQIYAPVNWEIVVGALGEKELVQAHAPLQMRESFREETWDLLFSTTNCVRWQVSRRRKNTMRNDKSSSERQQPQAAPIGPS